MRLRRWAVAIPAVKGGICGVIGVLALALALTLKGGQYDLLPVGLGLVSMPILLAAITYLLAAFLLSRGGLVWRSIGALLDAAPNLLALWILNPLGIGPSHPASIALAIFLVGIWLPVLVGAFRPTSDVGRALPPPTGSLGTEKR